MELVEAQCIRATQCDYDYYTQGRVYTLDWDYALRRGFAKHFEVSRSVGKKEATERLHDDVLPGQLKKGTVSGMDPSTFRELSDSKAAPSLPVGKSLHETDFSSNLDPGDPINAPSQPSDAALKTLLTGAGDPIMRDREGRTADIGDQGSKAALITGANVGAHEITDDKINEKGPESPPPAPGAEPPVTTETSPASKNSPPTTGEPSPPAAGNESPAQEAKRKASARKPQNRSKSQSGRARK